MFFHKKNLKWVDRKNEFIKDANQLFTNHMTKSAIDRNRNFDSPEAVQPPDPTEIGEYDEVGTDDEGRLIGASPVVLSMAAFRKKTQEALAEQKVQNEERLKTLFAGTGYFEGKYDDHVGFTD